MSANDRTAIEFTISEGQFHDAPQGRILLETVGRQKVIIPLITDKAFEDDLTRYIAQTLGFYPVIPPKSNRNDPREYDRELYKRRNEIERLFRLLDGFRRIFVRFEKLDVMYMGFVKLALVYLVIK